MAHLQSKHYKNKYMEKTNPLEEIKNKQYDKFIRGALNVGFTDDQADFLYDSITEIARNKALTGGMF